MRRWLIVLLLIFIPSVAVAAFAWNWLSHGIRVTVVNNGPERLSNVVAHVTGNAHQIGDLTVGESRTLRVRPTSESHLELAFDDHQGNEHRVNAGGYFEPGYRATIEIAIQDCGIVRNESEYLSPF